MANLSSKTGFTPVQTQVTLTLSGTTSIQDFAAYQAQQLTGFVEVLGSTNYRTAVTVMVVKNGANVYEVASVDLAGDNYSAAPLVSFSMSGTMLRVTLPAIAGATSAKIQYQLNAPALGGQFPLTVDSTSINVVDSAPLSYRNKIINGNFVIWQRGTGPQTTSGYGSDDRWFNDIQVSTATISRQTFALGQTDVPNNPKYFKRAAVTASNTVNGYVLMQQRIENVAVLANQTATYSFWAKADAAKNIVVEFAQIFGTGGTPSADVINIGTTTFALTTSWQKFTKTITVPSISGKTLGTNNNDHLRMTFWFDAGSNYAARTNNLGPQSGTFDIAQVQFEAGSSATAFEQRPIGLELSLCQRYAYAVNTSAGSRNGFFKNVTTTSDLWLFHPVQMRASPVVTGNITAAPYNYATGVVLAATSSYSASVSSPQSTIVSFSGHGAGTAGAGASFDLTSGLLVVSAEL